MTITRAEHAAIIENSGARWEQFERLHKDHFIGDKYVAVNDKGESIGRFATNSLARQVTNAASVRHEDFLTIKDQIIEIRRRRLNGISDLIESGLSFPEDVSEALVGFENVSAFEDAEQDMNPNISSNNDTNFNEQYSPLPITHMGFSIPWRQGSFDYKRSLGMTESIRKVSERLEKALFLGNSDIAVSYGGSNHPLYGYTTDPSRGTATISNWATVANIGSIHTELNREIGLMWSGQGGIGNDSCMVYVANDIWQNLDNDYKAESDMSVLDRCRRIPQVRDVKPAEFLADGDVVIVEMESRTIQLAVASDIIAVPHTKIDVFSPQAYTTYAAMTHAIKVDSAGNTGVRHLSK